MIAVSCCLVFLSSDDLDAVLAHQTPNSPVPDVQSQFLQLASHPGPPIALQAKAMLVANMSQDHHIITLSLAHRANAPRTIST